MELPKRIIHQLESLNAKRNSAFPWKTEYRKIFHAMRYLVAPMHRSEAELYQRLSARQLLDFTQLSHSSVADDVSSDFILKCLNDRYDITWIVEKYMEPCAGVICLILEFAFISALFSVEHLDKNVDKTKVIYQITERVLKHLKN